jgi:hypothetical protein
MPIPAEDNSLPDCIVTAIVSWRRAQIKKIAAYFPLSLFSGKG